jgi:hypothetical protein
MEDYIFLLIAVALSIFGAIKQKKKKNDENAVESNPINTEPSFMDNWLNNDFLEPLKNNLIPEPKVSFVKEKVPVIAGNEIPRQKYFHQDFKSTLPKRTLHSSLSSPITKKTDEESTDMDDSNNYLEDFSIRKAIIYSEIIKPKYF